MWKNSIMVVSFLLVLTFCNPFLAQDKNAVPESKNVPDVQINCFDMEDPAAVGSKTTYVLEVKNAGKSPASNIKINVQIPRELKTGLASHMMRTQNHS